MGQQYSHLSSEERILIEKLHCEQHLSVRKIAEEIGRVFCFNVCSTGSAVFFRSVG